MFHSNLFNLAESVDVDLVHAHDVFGEVEVRSVASQFFLVLRHLLDHHTDITKRARIARLQALGRCETLQ